MQIAQKDKIEINKKDQWLNCYFEIKLIKGQKCNFANN